jgi:NAD(P)-dependent dehydrogenase (short-subunit alcohol dehydrogenase family)
VVNMSWRNVMDFRERVVLVVGAGRGIGLACAQAFADCGATVAIGDVDESTGARALGSLAGDAAHSAHVIDLSNISQTAEIVDAVVVLHKRLDVLVSTVGALHADAFLDLRPESWDRTLNVNTRGSVFLAQAAAKHMIRQQIEGSIILFASIESWRTVRLNNTAYCASKAALVQAARCMALELAPHGITVNTVSPGSTATEMLLKEQMRGTPDAVQRVVHGDLSQWRLGIPLGRMAEPSDQAAAAVFLASNAARHITGQELIVDGGQTIP